MNGGNGVPSGSNPPRNTAKKAKDAINAALKSNSELQEMLLESGRKLTETEERITREQNDRDRLTAEKKLQEKKRQRINFIFGIVIAGVLSCLAVGALYYILRRVQIKTGGHNGS